MNAPRTQPSLLALPLPSFETPRLRLRSLTPGDAPAMQGHIAERRLAEGTRSIPHPAPPGAAAAFIAGTNAPERDEDVWAIEGTGPAASLLGVIALKPIDRGQSQIGYWISPGHWNSGIASEAVRLIVTANPHGARTLFAEVFQDNPASARVLTQAGFDFIGDAEAISLARGGARVPTWTYLRRMG